MKVAILAVDTEDERMMNAMDHMERIMAHYEHACKKHPAFADMLFNQKARPMSSKDYKEIRDTNHALGKCTPLNVLLAEYAEVIEAMQHGEWDQARYEVYDCIAVLLRMIDMMEEDWG